MKKYEFDVVVIGGGPAGMAAALGATRKDVSVCLIERDNALGGVLNQCIHSGFGLHVFNEELTGPEYAHRFLARVLESSIEVKLNTIVLNMTSDKDIYAVNSKEGLIHIKAKAIVLAMGCRERSRGATCIPGSRPAGVYTAGTAQRLVNIEGIMPGTDVVILGSGDIGLIMARRMTLEGAKVRAVIELMPYPGGLVRNVAQCLEDFDIPLYLSHTITRIHGRGRVSAVTVSPVKDGKPCDDESFDINCDTLLLSVGLIPENELSREVDMKMWPATNGPLVTQDRQTSVHGIFACGNVLHVHDLVDNVTKESEIAGMGAANYSLGCGNKGDKEHEKDKENINSEQDEKNRENCVPVACGRNVRYVVPQLIDHNLKQDLTMYIRAEFPEENVTVELTNGEKVIKRVKKRIVRPGETITFNISANIIEEIQGQNDYAVNIRAK